MASQKNTVTDYLAQRKGGTPSAVSGMGARFVSQTSRHQVPIAAPRTIAASTAESVPRSSSATLSEDEDDRVPETESSEDVLSRMTLEDLLLSPGRHNMLKLVPPSDNAEAESGAW